MPPPASGHRLPRGIAVTVIERAGSACGIAAAWLIGLPRRAGRRLHAVNDAEARQWGWQVIERGGGLVHQYRDARFDALRYEPALRRAELRDDAYHGDSAQPPPAGRSSGGDA